MTRWEKYLLLRNYNKIKKVFEVKTTLDLVGPKGKFKILDLQKGFLALWESGRLAIVEHLKSDTLAGEVGTVSMTKELHNPNTGYFCSLDELKKVYNQIIR